MMDKLNCTLQGVRQLNCTLLSTQNISAQLTVYDHKLKCALQTVRRLNCSLATTQILSAHLTVPRTIGSVPFEGEYEYTPSQDAQVIGIEGRSALHNIVINPIPNNYGLITWDGSVLTVS